MTVVSAVCVNFRSAHHVARMLDSLAPFDLAEILLLDNFSGSDELTRIAALADDNPRVKLYCSQQNIGFGAGVNRLVNALSPETDYVWILNPDVIVEPDSLRRLIVSAQDNACEIISPLILSDGGQRIWYSGGVLDFASGRSIHVDIGKQVGRRRAGFQKVSFITGAALLISLRAWKALGGFDESLFLYCEDADLSIRATKLGLVMGIEHGAVVHHEEGASSGGSARGPSATFYYFVQRNRLRVYASGRPKLAVLIGPGILETIRLCVLPWRPLNRTSPKRFIWSLRGIAAGLRGEQGPGKLIGSAR